jgi:integrase/recombinase XerD
LGAASQAAIDRFIDALWIEDGLAPLTLAAYRRDLSLLRRLAAGQRRQDLDADARVRPAGLHGGAPRRHARHHGQPAADVFKRYFRWAVREHLVAGRPHAAGAGRAPAAACAARR